jgi:YVTN family beta-propeller protein
LHIRFLLLVLLLAGCAAQQGGVTGGDASIPLPDSLVERDPGEGLRGMLVVTQNTSQAVTFINPDTRRVFAYARVGWDPRDLATSPDHRLVFVSNFGGGQFGAGTISVISPSSRREIDRLDLYPYGPFHGMACGRSGVYLYVASETRRAILEVNLMSRLVERTWVLPHGVPNEIALDASETRVYVTDLQSPTLFAVNLTGGDIQEARTGGGPEGIALAPDGSALWIANRDDGTISVLDPFTLGMVSSMLSGRGPVRIGFSPDGARAYVVNAGEGSVTIFDAHGRARLGMIPVGLYPLGIAIDPNGTRAYVASTRDNEISVLDLVTNTVVERIRVGPDPFDVAWVGR